MHIGDMRRSNNVDDQRAITNAVDRSAFTRVDAVFSEENWFQKNIMQSYVKTDNIILKQDIQRYDHLASQGLVGNPNSRMTQDIAYVKAAFKSQYNQGNINELTIDEYNKYYDSQNK